MTGFLMYGLFLSLAVLEDYGIEPKDYVDNGVWSSRKKESNKTESSYYIFLRTTVMGLHILSYGTGKP